LGRWKDFISLYDSVNTKKQYRAAIKTFFKSLPGITYESLPETSEHYFMLERDYEKDVWLFFERIRHRPPQVVRSRLSTVKLFLENNDVELSQRFWKNVKRKIRGSSAVSEERVPDNVDLRRILSHMRVKGKALFLALASSGLRIGEALQLERDDIYLDEEPVRINVRAEIAKTGDRRTTFISNEACEALKEWLKVREAWIREAVQKSRFKTAKQDNRIFPFSDQVAYQVWNGALDKAGLNGVDKTTNRHKMHIHTLRKFFRSKMGTVIKADIVEELIGHRNVYRKHSDRDLAKFYKQGEGAITVFGVSSVELKVLKDKVSKRETLMEVLLSRITKLEHANRQLHNEVKTLSSQIEDYDDFQMAFLAGMEKAQTLSGEELGNFSLKKFVDQHRRERREKREALKKQLETES
jgi:integrase